MKYLIPILIIICISIGFTQAQNVGSGYTFLSLPEGAIARIGNSQITGRSSITLSPDSTRLAVSTSLGIWIYQISVSKPNALVLGCRHRLRVSDQSV